MAHIVMAIVMACIVVICIAMAYIVMVCIVMVCIAMACIVMACIAMACIATACIVMACIVVACVATAYIVMACIVMACIATAYIVLAKAHLETAPTPYLQVCARAPQDEDAHKKNTRQRKKIALVRGHAERQAAPLRRDERGEGAAQDGVAPDDAADGADGRRYLKECWH